MPRILDIAIALVVLLLLSPVLLVAAIAIKLGSRGPVFYHQRRVGLDGREFEMLKLRTMVPGSDPIGVGTAVTRDDPRVTRAGRFLRRTSLDEIPNLVNVLRGEMAIVGPRPTIQAQVVDYTPRQHRRHEVRPGQGAVADVAVTDPPALDLDVGSVATEQLGRHRAQPVEDLGAGVEDGASVEVGSGAGREHPVPLPARRAAA